MKKKFFGAKLGLNRFFFLIFAVSCVVCCVLLSQVLASVITVGSFSFTSSTASVYSGYSLYAVSLGSYATKSVALENATTARKQNAGGYVYENAGKYFLIASIYEKENDAKSVIDNLKSSSISAEIIEIKIEKVEFEKISTKQLKKSYTEMLGKLKNFYLSLYDISVSIDTAVFSETKAKIEISNLSLKLEESLSNLSAGTSSDDGVYYINLKNQVNKIIELGEELVNYTSTSEMSFQSKIKYNYIEIVTNLIDLSNLLNNN